jgi:hypothetical protein
MTDGWDCRPDQLVTPGKPASIRTLGGVRRFSRQRVEHLMYAGDTR